MPSRPSNAQPSTLPPENVALELTELSAEEVAGLAAALGEEERGELVSASDVFARFDATLQKIRRLP
ncbi:MAG: hypothetical protein MUF34_06720 [Polyangiaceae bacterium]|jgi:hypothetical protein|nr:hypothetical protein [Polyangiaceae bacterium]